MDSRETDTHSVFVANVEMKLILAFRKFLAAPDSKKIMKTEGSRLKVECCCLLHYLDDIFTTQHQTLRLNYYWNVF